MHASSGTTGSAGKAFIVLGLLVGTMFLVLTPPFQAPDEWNHFFRSYQVSKGHLVSGKDSRGMPGEHLPMSLLLTSLCLFNNVPYTPEDMDALNALLQRGRLDNEDLNPFSEGKKRGRKRVILSLLDMPLEKEKTVFLNFPGTALYPPVPYIPQAAGMAAGRLLGAPPVALVYMGRAANLFVWVVLVYLAIRLTPVYGWLFLILALTPTSIFQAASLSADAVTNGSALLFLALVLRHASGGSRITTGSAVSLLLLVLILALSKFYIFMPFLFLLLPPEREKPLYRYGFTVLLFLSSALAAWAWAMLVKDLHILQRPGVFPGEQMALILDNPLRYLGVMAKTFSSQWLSYLRNFTGKLGHFGPLLPLPAVLIHMTVLLFSALGAGSERITIGMREKLIALAVTVLSTLAFITPLYLTWTPLGGDMIEGVQGRYFFPLAPLMLMLLYTKRRIPRFRGLPALCYIASLHAYAVYILLSAYYIG